MTDALTYQGSSPIYSQENLKLKLQLPMLGKGWYTDKYRPLLPKIAGTIFCQLLNTETLQQFYELITQEQGEREKAVM